MNDSVIIGLQADLSAPSLRVAEDISVGPCSHPACTHSFDFNNSGVLSINWIASALLRAGVKSSDNLFYALGGVSHADFSSDIVTINPTPNAPHVFSFVHNGSAANGWTFGLGWERRVADAWSIYTEYRYSRFSNVSQNYNFALQSCPGFGNCYSNSLGPVVI